MDSTVQNALIWAGSVVAAFIVYRLIFNQRPHQPTSDYDRKINEILTSEKYKVKGKFD